MNFRIDFGSLASALARAAQTLGASLAPSAPDDPYYGTELESEDIENRFDTGVLGEVYPIFVPMDREQSGPETSAP